MPAKRATRTIKKRVTRRTPSRAPRGRKTHSAADDVGRVRFLLFVMLFVIIVIVGRLWYLQVHDARDYRAKADDQHIVEAEIAPHRGTIFFRDGDGLYPAAINKPFGLIYVVPKDVQLEDHDRIVALFKDVLGEENVDEALVRSKLAKHDDPYEVIERRTEEDVFGRIIDADIPGVRVAPEIYRFYPAGEIAAQLIGFVGSDGEKYRGRYGLEASLEEMLAGQKGHVKQIRDAAGRWNTLTDREKVSARDGVDVVLTIDYAVQFEVEQILKDTVEKHDADSGSIVAMRSDGTILAMASQPEFDPNTYGQVEDISVYRNPIVSEPYESGSVVKPITMAVGLDAGVVTPESTYVDTGVVSIGGYHIRNSEDKVYGLATMYEVLEESINTGVIHVEKLVGHERFAEYFEKFGYGQATNVELPGESAGNVRNIQPPIKPIQFYTASFGQGITMTLLQLAQSYAVLANGGMLMQPRIIDQVIHAGGDVEERAPQELYRVIKADAAHDTREMLESVVINGHGKRAAVPGYRVGGKTGTAQVAKVGEGGYSDDVTIGSFAGLAPIEEPEFVVVVRIDNPKDVIWAESTAAPAFQKVMKFLLEYYNVMPTEELKLTPVNEEDLTTQTHE